MKNMNTDELVRKYMAAESTMEEEMVLRQTLLSGKAANEHPELEALFSYYEIQKGKIASPDFKNPASAEPSKKKGKLVAMPWLAAAASVVILVAAWFFFSPTDSTASTDTFSDPEIAAQNAAEAIQLLSGELNKGRTMAMDQMKEFENLNKYLNIF